MERDNSRQSIKQTYLRGHAGRVTERAGMRLGMAFQAKVETKARSPHATRENHLVVR